MKIGIISFTKEGAVLAERLVFHFRKEGNECSGYGKEMYISNTGAGLICLEESLNQWTKKMFLQMDAIVYIGATGIAVRGIAPFVKDKKTDPAIIVVDEQGTFAIALLSGHVGGANALAREIASVLQATPVITTASDVQGKTAVDSWALKHGLIVSDWALAKKVAAAIVNGEPVGFYSDYPIGEGIPEEYVQRQICSLHVWITCALYPKRNSMISMFSGEETSILRLLPKALFVGIGCKKGVGMERIQDAVDQTFFANNLDTRCICGIFSIDLKKEEQGLVSFGKKHGISYTTFSAEALAQVKQVSEESDFVKKITGIGNVCERAALLAAGTEGKLLVKKTTGDGIAIAVAINDYRIASVKKHQGQ